MEASSWWLLAIPLFFGLGWIASRLDAAQLFTQTRQLPESYFKGLNFLLNEQHDQAITSFEEVARLDPETAELYFALGNLFRKRGETERAIRIHRNLLERADLPEAQRQQALFCVAQDYLNAGIFDRAESAFSALAGTSYAAQAQRELAKLYEKESNWDAAIACLQDYLTTPNLALDERARTQEDLSHYACELATVHMQQKTFAAAQQALTLAEKTFPANPRTTLCNANLLVLQGEIKQATALLERLITAQPKLTTLAILALTGQANDPATLDALKHWALTTPSADSIKPLLPVLQAQGDTQGMLTLLQALTAELKHSPQRLASAGLLLSHSANPAFAHVSGEWQTQAHTAIDSLTARFDRPTCSNCGFKASRHQWRCPGCGRWNTLPYSAG